MVSEATHRRLAIAKMEMGFKSMDEMLARITSEISKARFLEASETFRSGMRRRHLSLTQVESSSETIRIELFRKWFQANETSFTRRCINQKVIAEESSSAAICRTIGGANPTQT